MAKDNSQSSSSGGWFKSGLFKINSIFGNSTTTSATKNNAITTRRTITAVPEQRKRPIDSITDISPLNASKRFRQDSEISSVRPYKDTPRPNISRTRRILDVLDSLGATASLADPPASNTLTTSSDMLNTQKWLHDISVGKSPRGGPPRTTLRTPSRLYSIISNVQDKPYWKRPTEMAAAAAKKQKEVSFEADTEPVDSEDGTRKTNNSELPKAHQPVLKSYTGRNIAGSLKSNTFNADLVDLEADISSEKTKKDLESIKAPAEFGKNLESGFLTKNRVFTFTPPVIRGPQVVEKSPEKEELSSDENSSDEEESEKEAESDKEVETVSTKAINSDTSTSSPENSKIQQSSSPIVTKPQIPMPPSNSWECSTCMVRNDASANNCVCCDTPKEGAANSSAPEPAFKATVFKPAPSGLFGVPVQNSSPAVTKPQAPTPAADPQIPKPASDLWECSTCMVQNAATLDKCPCCETPKGGSANSATSQPAFKPTVFKPAASSGLFGISVQPSTNTTAPASNLFNFGGPTPPSSNGTLSGTFKFGESAQSATASTQPPSNTTASASSLFNFGELSKPSSNGTVSGGFNFGSAQPSTGNGFGLKFGESAQSTQSPSNTIAPASKDLSFGLTTQPSSNGLASGGFNFDGSTQPSSNGTLSGTFKFGESAQSATESTKPPSNTTAPASSLFNFGGLSQPSSNGTISGGFNFGSAQPSTGNGFGLKFGESAQSTQPASNATPASNDLSFGLTTQPSTNGLVSGGFSFGGSTQPSSNGPVSGLNMSGMGQNMLLPVTRGSNSSNSRKLLLAKRTRR